MTAYIKSKVFSKSNHNQGLAILSILIVFSLFCLGLFYLIQTNGLVERSYQIRQLKEETKELETKNQELETIATSWQSPSNLEEMIQSLGMVEVGQVIYLEGEKVVAVKE
jgi:cell division protein FtsB